MSRCILDCPVDSFRAVCCVHLRCCHGDQPTTRKKTPGSTAGRIETVAEWSTLGRECDASHPCVRKGCQKGPVGFSPIVTVPPPISLETVPCQGELLRRRRNHAPMREVLFLRRVRDLSQVATIAIRGINIEPPCCPKEHGEHDAAAVGRPCRGTNSEGAAASLERDSPQAGPVHTDGEERALGGGEQDVTPLGDQWARPSSCEFASPYCVICRRSVPSVFSMNNAPVWWWSGVGAGRGSVSPLSRHHP